MEHSKEDLDQVISEVRALVSSAHVNMIDAFLKLRYVNNSEMWKLLPGVSTFSEFLKKTFPNYIGFDKYDHVIRAIDIYGEETVRKFGIEPCHAVIKPEVIKSPDRIELVKKAITTYMEQHSQTPPSTEEVRKIVKDVAPETRKPGQTIRKLEKEASLELENEALRREVKRLKTENIQLKKENDSLKKENNKFKKKIGSDSISISSV